MLDDMGSSELHMRCFDILKSPNIALFDFNEKLKVEITGV